MKQPQQQKQTDNKKGKNEEKQADSKKVKKEEKLLLASKFRNFQVKDQLLNILQQGEPNQPLQAMTQQQVIVVKANANIKKIIELMLNADGNFTIRGGDIAISRLVTAYEIFKRKGIQHQSNITIDKENDSAFLNIEIQKQPQS